MIPAGKACSGIGAGPGMMKEVQEAQAKLEQAKADLEAALQQAKESGEGETPADESHPEEHQKKKKPPGTERGIETMFRSAYRVQMDLTALADNKANMMISINGIIMSIIVASIAPKLDANPWLLVPTAILLIGSMVSIIYAIQAARPRVTHKPISLRDLRNSDGNILFFGNFANLSENEFAQGMEELMKDRPFVYDTMIRNIYGIGSVLNRKFVLLQVAYTAFMLALVLGMSAYMAVFIWVAAQTR